MKTQNYFPTMILLSISTWLLTSCNPAVEPVAVVTTTPYTTLVASQPTLSTYDELISTYQVFRPDFSDMVGDTIIPQRKVTLHTPPSTLADLSSLKNNSDPDLQGKPLRLIAVGGSLSAGVMNFGLYQESQQTAFPNLIAIQMGIKNFRQPLFGDNEYNGYGYKTLTNNRFGSPVPMYNVVKNNLAIQSKGKIINLNKYEGDVDNYSVPFCGHLGLNLDGWSYDNIGGYSQPFRARMINTVPFPQENHLTVHGRNAIISQKYDVFMLEIGLDNFINTFYGGNYGGGSNGFNPGAVGIIPPQYIFLQQARKINAKGCIANVPDIADFPLLHLITYAQIKKALNQDKVYGFAGASGGTYLENDADFKDLIFLPNSSIDSVLNPINKLPKRGSSLYFPLREGREFTVFNPASVPSCNATYEKWSKEFDYPIVDLYTLFKKISQGNYTTAKGTKVSMDFYKGNFLSSDGLTPTAFGQAIIANEFIKTFNNFYKTSIPLIREEDYLTR